MIKGNLNTLKYTVEYQRGEGKEEEGQQGFDPRFKWSHQPYHCKSRVKCRKLLPYDPELDKKKEEIEEINKRIK